MLSSVYMPKPHSYHSAWDSPCPDLRTKLIPCHNLQKKSKTSANFSLMCNLLQNGVFRSEFGARSSCFGRSIWHAAYRYVFWRLHFRDVRCCHLHFHTYHLQRISELGRCYKGTAWFLHFGYVDELSWKTYSIWKCWLSLYIPSSEVVWVGRICLKPFDVVPKGFELFFACDEVMFVHVHH